MGIMLLNKKISPFLKWAGGKRWLADAHSSLFDIEFNRYFEPFLGSGAVFFHLDPRQALLSDLNSELIETYISIRDDWQTVYLHLENHHKNHSSDYYYHIRSEIFLSRAERAARFIYLNRTCWNGLYRVNLKGEFNVPIGTKKNAILESDNFEEVSNVLRGKEIVVSDFEATIQKAGPDDLIFVDPPYTVRHNTNGFVKYNERIFSWQDQIRLAACLKAASERGCYFVATNANHPSVIELYNDSFSLNSLKRKSVIAANSEYRGKYDELLIRNF